MRTLRYMYKVEKLSKVTELVMVEQGCEPRLVGSRVCSPGLSGLVQRS